jgi:hypothetical protein
MKIDINNLIVGKTYCIVCDDKIVERIFAEYYIGFYKFYKKGSRKLEYFGPYLTENLIYEKEIDAIKYCLKRDKKALKSLVSSVINKKDRINHWEQSLINLSKKG